MEALRRELAEFTDGAPIADDRTTILIKRVSTGPWNESRERSEGSL